MIKLAPLLEALQAFPGVVRRCTSELAALGWFVDMGYGARHLDDLSRWIQAGEITAVDDFLVKHLIKRQADIQSTLLKQYPARSPALQEAFRCASMEMYYAAIPVLLAQVDGVAVDILGGKFFKSDSRRPQVAAPLLSRQLDDIQRGYLSAFEKNSGINASDTYEHEFPHSPNRHKILHGLDNAYGTQVTYFKALSLLNFVALVVPIILNDYADKPPAK